MSKQANPYTVGVFVVGAIALVVVGVIVFGSGIYLKKRPSCIMYFEGSVNGLKVGAPVTLRGVQVGEVSSIKLLASHEKLTFRIPVMAEFDEVAIRQIDKVNMSPGEFLDALVNKGLRAQLQSQSIVTGMLFVNLDFFPGTNARLVNLDPSIREIPTIPSKLEQLSRTLEDLPILETIDSANKTLESIHAVLGSEDARSFFPKLNQSLDAARSALARADTMFDLLDTHLGPAVQSIEHAAQAASLAADHAAATFSETDDILSDDSEFRYETGTALRAFTRALRSMRALTDYLERHPDSLVFGKSAEKGSENE